MSSMIIEQCKTAECLKHNKITGKCNVFREPAYQWRDGRECWGLCASKARMELVEEQIRLYSTWLK